MTKYQAGLPTEQHDKIDVNAYNRRVYDAVKNYEGGVIADVFSGGGRDILALYETLGGNGKFVAIDSDPARIADMIAKNDELSKNHPLFKGRQAFTVVDSDHGLRDAFNHKSIAVIQGRFPERPFGSTDIDLKTDFMLCNAGLMFLNHDDMVVTLNRMSAMLNRRGEMTLRFSMARDDKKNDLGKSYFIHRAASLLDTLDQNGLNTKRHPDLQDPGGRNFEWVDIEAKKPVNCRFKI